MIDRRQWLTLAAGSVLAAKASGQSKQLPLRTTGLDHLSITLPDPLAAANSYGAIFDPQVFHERTGVQRYYVRLGSAYLAFGPNATAAPYIDHIAVNVVGLDEDKFTDSPTRAEMTSAGISAAGNGFVMVTDPDQLRVQLVNATHGLFDTLMPGGRVTIEPPAFIPMGLDHIVLSVPDIEKSAAHYRKLFGLEEKDKQRVWFKLANTRLGLEAAPSGQKPSFSHYCVKVAGFDSKIATARLQKLGIKMEAGSEKGTLRFRDLHNIAVEVVAG